MSQRTHTGLLVGMGLLCVSFVLLSFTTLGDNYALGDGPYYSVMVLATALAALRVATFAPERRAWLFVTLSLGSDLVADGIENAFSLTAPSVADVIWLASYAFMFIALVDLGRLRLGRANRIIWLDGVIAVLTLSALGSALFMPAIVSALPADSLASAATLAYPIADITMLATILVILAMSDWRIDRSWQALIAGIFVWTVGDVVFSYQDAMGTYSGGPVDLTWPLSSLLIAFAAWQPLPEPTRQPSATRRAGSLANVCGFLALVLIVVGNLVSVSEVTFYFSAAALCGLGIRHWLVRRENERLLKVSATDALTGIGSRGKLSTDAVEIERSGRTLTVAIFDLDGFKFYNDSFGHAAGDELLRRLAGRMAGVVGEHGSLYRIGGDEFVALIDQERPASDGLVERIRQATCDRGESFDIQASMGVADFPGEGETVEAAIALADERLYAMKAISRTSARNQVHEALVRSIREREPELAEHTDRVTRLSVAVARRFISDSDQLDVIWRAAQLHDVGKVAIPDSILQKPGPLDEEEVRLMNQHTLIGERIINASPALAPVGRLVRSSHEHWDGSGYPDQLSGTDIPLGSRIILACDALDAMTGERTYCEAIPVEAAFTELERCSGTQFDPDVVAAVIAESGTPVPSPTAN